jgi:hypothetical protein
MLFGDSEKSIPADVRNVLDAAALLQVSEFCLFQLAYRYWHGSDASEQSIERHFVPYMFRSVVPFWVRQLCRRVLEASADGTLDPVDFGVEPTRVGEHQPVLFVRALAVGGTLVGMLLLACGLFASY